MHVQVDQTSEDLSEISRDPEKYMALMQEKLKEIKSFNSDNGVEQVAKDGTFYEAIRKAEFRGEAEFRGDDLEPDSEG